MSKFIAITAIDANVVLEEQGPSRVRFQLTNTGSRPVRFGLRLIPEGRLPASCLAVLGPRVQELPVDGSAEREVEITPPAGLKSGEYVFRLLVFDVANPDDRYLESPPVSVHVQAAAVSPPAPLRRSWIVTAITGLVAPIVVIVLGLLLDSLRSFNVDQNARFLLLIVIGPAVVVATAVRRGHPWSIVYLCTLSVPGFMLLSVVFGAPHEVFALVALLICIGWLAYDERWSRRPLSRKGVDQESRT